jgi:uncharacterized protein
MILNFMIFLKNIIIFSIVLLFVCGGLLINGIVSIMPDGFMLNQTETTEIIKSLSPTPTRQVTSTPLPVPTQKPDPFSIEALKTRSYGEGEFTVDRLWYTYERFDRYYVIYDSDGLSIHGYVNIPKGEGPFPVIFMLHGYISPDEYDTLDYTVRYTDDLARNGYIVLHPNMRNFPPSDSVERRRDSNTGYTIDVLNMLAYFKEMAGEEGIFATADVERIGIWGHSIGGSIALRTMSAAPDVFNAAVLYSAVSQRYGTILDSPDIYDLSEVEIPFSIHHGESDEVISVAQSQQLCLQLKQIGKDTDCYFYEGQPHTLYRDQTADPLFMDRVLAFFDEYVKRE